MMDKEKKGDVVEEPAVVPSDLQQTPPSKAASLHSSDHIDNEKKYETIQTIKMNDPSATANNTKDMKSTSMDKPMSIMNSSLNLLSNQEIQHEASSAAAATTTRKGVTANTKLGIIQLVLSVLLSAFGGLLVARNASLSMMGSGIWAGIFAGVCGALGLMNIKPLLNGFLACSLISVATSTLALALTGIGLVRDYNISKQDPEFESAVMAACGLTILLILHLLTSMFSVYHSALQLCSKEHTYNAAEHAMNYEKVQKYLKSLQAAGVSNYDLNGYQNYINSAKLHRQRSMINSVPPPPPSSHHHHHHPAIPQYHVPIYAPASVSSGYMANARMYTMPHSYQSNFYQDYYYTHDERRSSPRDSEKRNERRKKSRDHIDDANLSYTGADRELADSYLKSIEHRDQHL